MANNNIILDGKIIVRILIFSKLIYMFEAIPIRVPMEFFWSLPNDS